MMKTLDGEIRFPLLVKLMTVLMSIPSSNAKEDFPF